MLLSDILDLCLINLARKGIDLRLQRDASKCKVMRGEVCVIESENIAHVVERLHAYYITISA